MVRAFVELAHKDLIFCIPSPHNQLLSISGDAESADPPHSLANRFWAAFCLPGLLINFDRPNSIVAALTFGVRQ